MITLALILLPIALVMAFCVALQRGNNPLAVAMLLGIMAGAISAEMYYNAEESTSSESVIGINELNP